MRQLFVPLRPRASRVGSRAFKLAITFGFIIRSSSEVRQAAGDRDEFQGHWQVIALGGEMATALSGIVGHGTITVAGDTMSLRGVGNADDARDRFLFTLDTVPSPRHIDLVAVASSDGEAWTGSYRIAADTLELALPIEHGGGRSFRPRTFSDPNTLVLILRRDKR